MRISCNSLAQGGFFMLFLFNRAKIVSYLVIVFTIVALFTVSYNWQMSKTTLQVTANEKKLQSSYSLDTNENKSLETLHIFSKFVNNT